MSLHTVINGFDIPLIFVSRRRTSPGSNVLFSNVLSPVSGIISTF